MDILDISISLAKQAKEVMGKYNELMGLDKDSCAFKEKLEELQDLVKVEQEAYIEVLNESLLYKLSSYIVKALESLEDNPSSTILFLRMNNICETLILKSLEESSLEHNANIIAKSIESTCLINGLYILEKRISNTSSKKLKNKLNMIKYTSSAYNKVLEDILLPSGFTIPCINYQEPLLFSKLLGNIKYSSFNEMRIKVTTVLIHDLVNNLIDAMHDNKQDKILEYSCYIEGALGILSLEERREILKIYIPLFKNDSYLSFYLLNIFNNVDNDLKLIKSNSLNII